MAKREQWETDETDGLKREIVHHWVEDKHARLRNYVGSSREARKKFSGNCTYIDLFCSAGRARILETGEVVDGSALSAAKVAAEKYPFGQLHIGDKERTHVEAHAARLQRAGFNNVSTYVGCAEETVLQVGEKLNKFGLHLALLDPYNLEALPFSVIATLGAYSRMDLLIHVSSQDLQREAFGKQNFDRLDRFAPGWREHVDLNQRQEIARRQFLEFWKSKIRGLGYTELRDTMEDVRGDKNQPLYWLFFASKHQLGQDLWDKIRNISPQTRLAL